MRSLCVFSGFLICAFATAADSNTASRFAGTWEGKYKDTTFCALKVNSADGLSGSMSVGQIETEDDGDLKSVGPITGDEHALIKPRIEAGKLLFGWNDDPSEQPIDFEFRLTGSAQGELRFLSTPPNVKIKPLKLEKKE